MVAYWQGAGWGRCVISTLGGSRAGVDILGDELRAFTETVDIRTVRFR